MAVDGNVKPKIDSSIPLLCSSTMLKDEMESWGKPRMPLRPPLYVPPDLARGQLEGPGERRGSCIPVDILRAPKDPYKSPPASAKGPLATVEVNRSVGLAGSSQMGQDYFNVSQKFPGRSPSLTIEGTRVSNEGAENGVDKAKFHLALQQRQGFFPLRAPLVKDPPLSPIIRSEITMDVPPGKMRMADNERMAPVAFPMRGPWNPMDNWPRPITVPPNVSRLGWFTNGPGFMPNVPPHSHPFPNIPMPFSPPLMSRPSLIPYFGNSPSSELPPHPFLNREHKP